MHKSFSYKGDKPDLDKQMEEAMKLENTYTAQRMTQQGVEWGVRMNMWVHEWNDDRRKKGLPLLDCTTESILGKPPTQETRHHMIENTAVTCPMPKQESTHLVIENSTATANSEMIRNRKNEKKKNRKNRKKEKRWTSEAKEKEETMSESSHISVTESNSNGDSIGKDRHGDAQQMKHSMMSAKQQQKMIKTMKKEPFAKRTGGKGKKKSFGKDNDIDGDAQQGKGKKTNKVMKTKKGTGKKKEV